MIIDIKETINSPFAVSDEKGKIIYNLIHESFENREKVVLDFTGINSTISTFFNSAYALLFKDFTKEYIDENLEFKNIKEITKVQIEAVKENAIKFYSRVS